MTSQPERLNALYEIRKFQRALMVCGLTDEAEALARIFAAVSALANTADAALRKYGCGTALECDVCVQLRDALDRVRILPPNQTNDIYTKGKKP